MSNRDYEYNSNICKVKKVQFSLLSPEEIKGQATCQVIDHTLYVTSQDGVSTPSPGGLYDLKMGAIDSNVICETCEQRSSLCPGHFGYIQLAAPVFHMHFMSRILKLLKCICFRCSKLLLSDEELEVDSKDIYEKFDLIYEKSKKKKICGCANGCGSIQPTRYSKEGIGKVFAEWIYKDQENKKVLVKPDYVLKIFKRITDEDCIKLGFSPSFCRPEWLICEVLPVAPPAVRPSVKQDNNQRSDDDLTYKLIDIVKANSKLLEKINSGQTEYIDDHITVLQYHIATLINNDQPFGAGVPQANVQRSGRTLKSLQQRVKSKDGRIRGNLMGKRVDFSARSVITPDPFIGIDELGVPINIAKNLTFPEKVTEYNIERLKKAILNGYDNWPGVKSIKKTGEDSIKNLKHVDLNKMVDELRIGDICNRHLVDGDVVLFNRQPSLHKMSMMAHRIIVMKANTFRLNVCVTSPYNADFDGDEMNMHVPQSYQTISELKNLAMVPTQIISPQEGKPVIGLVQDALLGASRLTLENDELCYIMTNELEENKQFLFNKKQMMNLMMWNKSFTNTENISESFVNKNNCKYWTGKQIFSTVLPSINVKNSSTDIEQGELTKGYLVKKNLATSNGSLIHTIFNDLGKDDAAHYLNDCQGITNNFLLQTGFSVGISDLIINRKVVKNINDIIEEKKMNVNEILLDIQKGLLERKYHTSLNEEFETLATQELNTATDEAGKLTSDSLDVVNNRFVNMVQAGSKGNIINICQMIACVGQCSVDGRRIPKHYKNRTLPHFSQFDNSAESRGFVENSFYKGLQPHEFYFHAMGGREGIIDTAVKTSETGYIQRRLIKALEDVKVNYDLTLRNHNEEIIQFLYGEDGLESSKLEKQHIDELIDIDMDEFNNRYLNTNLVMRYINNDIKINKADYELKTNELAKNLMELRKYIVKNISNEINNEIYQSINIDRIILNNRIKFKMHSLSDLSPNYLFEEVDKLIEKIRINRKDIDNINYNPTYILHNIIRFKLSPYNLYVKNKISKLAFDTIVEEIIYRFNKGFSEAGEMVGTITAQSIGEPATQMTLNTFHFAGVAAKSNVTRGVPRLKELLSVSKSIKNPSLSIYLKDVKDNDVSKIKKIKNNITKTCIRDLVKCTAIYFDPDVDDTILVEPEHKEILTNEKEWEKFLEESDYKCQDSCEETEDMSCPYVLVIEISKKKLLDKNMNMELLAQFINETFNKDSAEISCILGNNNTKNDKLLLRIRLTNGDVEDDDFNLLKLIEKNILDIKISGVNNITGSNVRKINTKKIDDIGNIYDKKQVILDTSGSNLLDVLALDDIDTENTISNDIHEVLAVLGIEAARTILMEEFMDVIDSAGSSLNPRHIQVLVDTMTFSGNIMSIDRFGINRSNYGPIAKASFEEMTDQLYRSAIFGEVDNCEGVSANVLFGQEARCGTGCCDILFDESKFFAHNNLNMKDHSIDENKCKDILSEFIYSFDEEEDSNNLVDIFDHEVSVV